jgi:hypothetical protein
LIWFGAQGLAFVGFLTLASSALASLFAATFAVCFARLRGYCELLNELFSFWLADPSWSKL